MTGAARVEGRRRPCDPAVERQADLGRLTVDELDPLRGEPDGEIRRRRGGLDLGEAVAVQPDRDLDQRVASSTDAMHGEGVEDLVREDDALDRLGPGRVIAADQGRAAGVVRGDPRGVAGVLERVRN